MTVALGADEYQRSAEYVDVLLAEHWRELEPLVAAGLRDVSPAAGPVVDVGAGTGRGVLAIVSALPDAEIIAVEPSAAMRAVLMARVCSDDDLRRRVTVSAGELSTARLPERVSAVVAMNMIGHLDRNARRTFWSALAARLAPGAPALVNLQPPAEAVEIPETPMAEAAVGRYTYRGSGRAVPTGADRVTWHMTYQVLDGDVTVAEDQVSYGWWVLSEAQLLDEVAAAGLRADSIGPDAAGAYVLRTVDT